MINMLRALIKKIKKVGNIQKPFTKINLKWIIDLNVKHKSIKLLEDNLDDFWYGDGLLDAIPNALLMK